MNLSIEVNTRELENKLYLLAKAARVTPGQVIKEETRLLAQNIIQLTPPKTNAQGRAAVKRDLGQVATVLPKENAIGNHWKALNRLAAAKNVVGMQKILNKWRGSPRFTMDRSQIAPEHLRKRTRYGRVHGRAQLFTFARTMSGYLREVQSRVGWAKGAWVSALVAAGGRAPSWYGRHAANSGSVTAEFGENPRVHAVARNIKIPNFQRVVNNAVRNRERVAQKKIDRLIAGKATNLGFVTILER